MRYAHALKHSRLSPLLWVRHLYAILCSLTTCLNRSMSRTAILSVWMLAFAIVALELDPASWAEVRQLIATVIGIAAAIAIGYSILFDLPHLVCSVFVEETRHRSERFAHRRPSIHECEETTDRARGDRPNLETCP